MIFGCVGFDSRCIVDGQPSVEICLQMEAQMASPLIDHCDQANPGVLAEVRRLGSAFRNARRVQVSLVAAAEKQALLWMAERTPAWVNSDHLTVLGFLGQIMGGVFYALAAGNKYYLLFVIGCLAINWVGDSLDGTLARVRRQQRPRYGFYVDHMVDSFGAVALMGGLALSGYMHPWIAAGLLIAFLMLSIQSYLATYTLGEFRLSFWHFGPTEIRILLAVGNLALLRWPMVLQGDYRLFDVGGAVAIIGMTLMLLFFTAKSGLQLYREETLRWKSGEVGLRWLKFNFVGAIGIGVQLIVLTVLKSGLHLNYLLATAFAVEAAVIHNYLWHERFTWADRVNHSVLPIELGGATGVPARLLRFLKFNLTTGLFSILGNIVLMKLLVGYARINYVFANLLTIATCSLVNFLASDRFVFQN
jgi:putative flippase GtrA